MKSTATKPCPACDAGRRGAKSILCGACWRRMPRTLRGAFLSAKSHTTKVAALKPILAWAQREKTEPKLF